MELLGSIGSAIIGGIGKLIGGKQDSDAAAKQQAAQLQAQREFAQQGIQWKVADAKAAGIHPLFGLGASTTGFSPIPIHEGNMGDALGQMGQGVGRAAAAMASGDERALLIESARLDVENKRINNEIGKVDLQSKIARLTQGVPPPFPSDADIAPRELLKGATGSGKGDRSDVEVKKDSRQFMKFGGWEPRIANIPDAQTIQNRYGDIMEELYGLGVLGADVGANIYPPVKRFMDWWRLPINPRTRWTPHWRIGN